MSPAKRLIQSEGVDDPDLMNMRLNLLEQALETVTDAVVVVDAGGDEVLRNESAMRFADGRHGDALIAEAIGIALEQARGGVTGDRDLELFGPPQEVLNVRAQTLSSDGKVDGAVAFVRDITEARRVEAVRRDFVANVSHELKTPIGALALLADTMASGGDEEMLREMAERIAHEAERLGNIVDDLLALSLLDAEESPARYSVAVGSLIAEAIGRIASVAAAAEVSVSKGAVDGELVVDCDPGQIVSALTNLLDNAVKYSDPGDTVEIAASCEQGLITIEVVDHGIGIPSRDRERVFERFYRVDRARSRATGGTGLGLAIVRNVAQVHGGDVMLESREGEGSVFRLRLPAGCEESSEGERGPRVDK